MARPRKPSNVLALKGSFAKNPKRAVAREHEPEPVGDIGDVPDHLSEKEKSCWREILKLCHSGSLCSSDRLVIEHGARILAALRASEEYSDTKLMVRLEATLGRLGLSPGDRSRVHITKANPVESPFAKFRPPG